MDEKQENDPIYGNNAIVERSPTKTYIFIILILTGLLLHILLCKESPMLGYSWGRSIGYSTIGLLFWVGFLTPIIGSISNAERYYNLKSIAIAIYIGVLYKILSWFLPLP